MEGCYESQAGLPLQVERVIAGLLLRNFTGPYQIECSFLEIERAGLSGIDIWQTGQKIKKVCLEHGYTVRRLQKKLEIGFQSVYAWFAGAAVPSLDHMYQLSRLLGTPMEQMLAEVHKEGIFCLKLEKADKSRTVRLIGKYYAWELRRCMDEYTEVSACAGLSLQALEEILRTAGQGRCGPMLFT